MLCDWKANHKGQVSTSSKLCLFLSLICIIILICERYAAFLVEKSGSAVTLRAKQGSLSLEAALSSSTTGGKGQKGLFKGCLSWLQWQVCWQAPGLSDLLGLCFHSNGVG